MSTIYILQLEHGKYYVGNGNIPDFRYFTNEWTRLHRPLKFLKRIESGDVNRETLIAMSEYGIDNVRGGSYSKTQMTYSQFSTIEKQINSLIGACYKCGEVGHVATRCINNTRYDSGHSSGYENNDYESDNY